MKSLRNLSTWPALLACAGLTGLPSWGYAQTQSNASANPDDVVRMSSFEVTTTQGHGYVATNAATGLKTNEPLMQIPQEVTVVSRDLIDDVGYENSSDVLQYFGLSDFYAGESLAVRGYRIIYAYEDDMPSNQSYEDDAIVDSYEVIKGPAQVLYVAGTLSGVVLKALKKPLPHDQYVVTAQLNDWGQYRFTGDFTGPIGTIADAKLSYRVVVVGQNGGNWADNVKDDRFVVFPSFEINVKDTTLRVDYDHQSLFGILQGDDLLTPGGKLWTGAGRDQVNTPPNAMGRHESNRFGFHMLQKISKNWENKLQASVWSYLVYGGDALPTADNWTNNTENMEFRLDNIRYSYWTVMDDFHGDYHLGPLPNQDGFGFAYSDYTVNEQLWTSAAPPLAGVPIGNSAAINAIMVPQAYQYAPQATGVNAYTKTTYGDLYWMHTIDVIPNWLTLVGGWTWTYIGESSVPNTTILPWTSTVESFEQYLHRIGAVFHLTKNISLYAMEATSMNPPSQGQLLVGNLLPPPQVGLDEEVGIKSSLFDGRVSTSVAYFHMTLTNVLEPGPIISGEQYFVPVGDTVQEGMDSDVAFTILRGWQLIGSLYAGHDRDQNNNPVSNSYDNSWSAYTRYDFDHTGPLGGLSLGGGVVRIGGRWISDAGMIAPAGELPANGEIKLATGTLVNGFINYQVNRHLMLRVNCDNILNQTYALGDQSATLIDPSPPRTWGLEAVYKF